MRSILSFRWVAACVFGLVGCADLIGIETWNGPPASSSGAGSGTGGSDLDNVDDPNASGGTAGSGPNARCIDGLQNGDETGVDCGGNTCDPCAAGNGCIDEADCVDGYCSAHRQYCMGPDGRESCAPGTGSVGCGDCLRNGNETDIDCGGDKCEHCRAGRTCTLGTDCASAQCDNNVCAKANKGVHCFSNDDCASGSCGKVDCVGGNCCQ